ncbi:unnamed protein product [Rotaria sp. Silwood2]|nr:unnamed protein product [Rotaria sp. Silwood2]CAF4418559.1 unnamed protein product [Rotaria sp. Silwood2]
MASGINYLHTQNNPILHGDIKSSNCLIQRAHGGYMAKLCDFGLAKTKKEMMRQTVSKSAFAGTLQWAAPEILRAERYTLKVDIYSLGIVYWELAATKRPYDDFEELAIRPYVLANERLEIPDSTPSKFKMLIDECWSPHPDTRPESSELVKILESILPQGNYLVASVPFNEKVLNKIPRNDDSSSPA